MDWMEINGIAPSRGDCAMGSRNTPTLLEVVDFDLYPNPARDEAFITLNEFDGQLVEINIFNTLGKNVFQQLTQPDDGEIRIKTSAFQNGLYFISITIDKQKMVSKKLYISRMY